MNGCFDNQLPAVVFDGVKTSRMPSCEAVTIGRDVRGVASLAWGGVRGTGGDWSVRMVCSFVVLESYSMVCKGLCDAIPVSFDPCSVTLFQLGRGVRRRSTASGRAARWRCGSLIGH